VQKYIVIRLLDRPAAAGAQRYNEHSLALGGPLTEGIGRRR